jgi:tRNA (guanine37-N1)-methyltransferase
VVRLLPGVLGDGDSHQQDSFSVESTGERLLDCPHFTKPREWQGREVPEVLLNGDHGKIAAWRLEQKKNRTKSRRPDLLGS